MNSSWSQGTPRPEARTLVMAVGRWYVHRLDSGIPEEAQELSSSNPVLRIVSSAGFPAIALGSNKFAFTLETAPTLTQRQPGRGDACWSSLDVHTHETHRKLTPRTSLNMRTPQDSGPLHDARAQEDISNYLDSFSTWKPSRRKRMALMPVETL